MNIRKQFVFGSLIILAIIFAIDALTPRGLAVWSAYALPVLIISTVLPSRQALGWTILVTVLLWVGAFLPPGEMSYVPWWVAAINRSLMTTLFFAIYFVGSRRKRDEDQMKELTDMLDRRAQELEVSNKELESFSYSVSHDLRAPLRAIDGFSRILVEEYEQAIPEDGRRYLQIMRDNTILMGRLIDDLLSFSRLSRQQMKKRTFNLSMVINEALEMLQPQMEGRDVRLEIKPTPECRADPSLIKHVVLNLLSNSLKFTQTRPTAMIEVGAQQLDGKTAYYVKDNGVGFDMKYVAKVFGVFQRLHGNESYEGTGVGLAIVQRIIHRHGGEIWAEAEPDKGATFFFTLGETRKGQNHDDGTTSGNITH